MSRWAVAAENINLMECSHITFSLRNILIWTLQTRCFVAVWILCHVDGVLIYLQSFDDFHVIYSMKYSALTYEETHGGPNWGWQNVMMVIEKARTSAGCILGEGGFCGGVCRWRVGLWVGPCALGAFLLCPWWDFEQLTLKAQWELIFKTEWLLSKCSGCLYFLIYHLFFCSLTHSLASQFLQKSIKSLAKSSLRQRSHSRMQTSGLAPSN